MVLSPAERLWRYDVTTFALSLNNLCPLPKSLSQVWERDFEGSGSLAPSLGVGAGGRALACAEQRVKFD